MDIRADQQRTDPELKKLNICFELKFKLPELEKEQVKRIHKRRVMVGSVDSADIQIDAEGIEPIHAVIELDLESAADQPQALIYDLASSSGVRINGKKIVTEALKPGDKIQIGECELSFSVRPLDQVQSQIPHRMTARQTLFVPSDEELAPLILESDADIEDIFDYQFSSQPALEVVMSWRESILNIEHFLQGQGVTVGHTRASDFGIPSVFSVGEFPIISSGADRFVLNLSPNMKGVIQRKGKLIDLAEAYQRGPKGDHGAEVILDEDDFAKISIGEVSFYLGYTEAPPRLKRQRILEKDAFLRNIVLSALVFCLAGMFLISTMEIPDQIEVEELPERIATIIYQPEKYTQVTPPKRDSQRGRVVPTRSRPKAMPPEPMNAMSPSMPMAMPMTTKIEIQPGQSMPLMKIPKYINTGVMKSMGGRPMRPQPKGNEGEGARASGRSGRRGTRTAMDRGMPQYAGMSPMRGQKGAGGRPRTGQSQISGSGNVDLFKGFGEKVENLIGSNSRDFGRNAEKLEGFGGFTTQGSDGLALSGGGTGGGGTSATGLGLGNEGKGGGRVGTGLGAAGKDGGIIGGKTRVVLQTGGPEESVVMGQIDKNAVEAAILAHLDEFKFCYEREINAGNPKLSGTVHTQFLIATRGKVSSSKVVTSSLKNRKAEDCVLRVIRRIQFPIPRGGGRVEVRYPFKFRRTGS